MGKTCLLFILFFFLSCGVYSQSSFIRVQDSLTREDLPGASLLIKGTQNGAVTDLNGIAEFQPTLTSVDTLIVRYVGYQDKLIIPRFTSSANDTLLVLLQADNEQLEEIIVSSTRTGARIEDAAVKVEVLGSEEMNEEASVKPGNVASILGDVSSVQIQSTSPVANEAVVRLQGLDAKYTLLLKDGMPAIGDISKGFSILTIPPLDLKQIEIIKGPSSTLNGGGAIAGLINFVSKDPADSSEYILMLNQNSVKETNFNTYLSGRNAKTGYTFFAGYNYQRRIDVNSDTLTDLPDDKTLIIHPQFFYYPNAATQIKLGLTANYDDRNGGDMQVLNGYADSTHRFFVHTKAQTGALDLSLINKASNGNVFSFKSIASNFSLKETTNKQFLSASQLNGYAEVFYLLKKKAGDFVLGGNYVVDGFYDHVVDSAHVLRQQDQTAGIFFQYRFSVKDKIDLEAGLRDDYHTSYGNFALPSAALLYHLSKTISIRLNAGSGYRIPGPLDFTQNIPDSLAQLFSGFKAERSAGGTAEWNYHKLYTGGLSLFINQTYFLTDIRNAVLQYNSADGTAVIGQTENGIVSTRGIDNYVRMNYGQIEFYFGYTFTLPRQNSISTYPAYLLYTPLHKLATTFIYSFPHDVTAGIEASFNGRQYREDATTTPDYLFMAASVKYVLHAFTFVLNGENLLNVKQTSFESIYTGTISDPQFKTLWAPVDGRAINFSVLVKL